MNGIVLGILAVAAALALAVWLGFSNGREHSPARSAQGAAGSAG